jgi:hypothetical protein
MSGKWKATLSLLVMFGVGIIGGMALQNYRFSHGGLERSLVARRLATLKEELKLTGEQTEAIKQIFHEARERAEELNEEVSWDLDDIHRESMLALENVLTSDQIKQLERLHLRSHGRRTAVVRRTEQESAPRVAGPQVPADFLARYSLRDE